MAEREQTPKDPWAPERGERLADAALLTPRVLDERVFEGLSGELRELMCEAIRRGGALRDATADAERFAGAVRETESKLRERLEQSAKIAKALRERAERAERTVALLEDADAIGDRVEEIIEARLRESEKKLEARLDALNERIEARVLALEGVEKRVKEAEARAAEVDNALAQRVDQALDACGEMVDKADRARDLLDRQLRGVLDQIERQRTELDETLGPVRKVVDRAVSVLGIDPDDPDAPGTLDRLENRARSLRAGLQDTTDEISKLASNADTRRDALEKALQDAENHLDRIERKRVAIEGPLAQQADRLSVLTPDLLERFERAGREIGTLLETVAEAEGRARRARDELSNHSSQLDALTEGAKRALQRQAEEAGTWLGSLVQRVSTREGVSPPARTTRIDLDERDDAPAEPSARSRASSLATPIAPNQAIPSQASTITGTAVGIEPKPESKPEASSGLRPAQTPAAHPTTAHPSPLQPVEQSRAASTPSDAGTRHVLREPSTPIDAQEFDTSHGNVFPVHRDD